MEDKRIVAGPIGNRVDDIYCAVLKADGSVDFFVREEVKGWTLATIKRSLSSKISLGKVKNAAGEESEQGGQMLLDFIDIESGNLEWNEMKWFFSADSGTEIVEPKVVKDLIRSVVERETFKDEFITVMKGINPHYNDNLFEKFVDKFIGNSDSMFILQPAKVN
ncbi:hypothetical protein EZV61_18450 [Corallincola luteus]|uniref:Uncharacterized protein n=1 Tax=Corallincola luteus TaxID=1775177 RepID=A0ABY2AJC5_9GAMM|nr:hypothetical protein [Corallincola luteus]TCI01367.1 hypothetical protein EZV61_18450 [Corallincola luteus]